MKRKLLLQMSREWSGNIWLVIELTVIFVILWMACSQIYAIIKIYEPDSHYDISKDYYAWIKAISEDLPEAKKYETIDQRLADIDLLVNQLRNNKYVKGVGRTSNGIPYNYNFWGHNVIYVEDGDTISFSGNVRFYDDEAIKIMGLTGTRGETPEQIASELNEGKVILSSLEYIDDFEHENISDPEKLRGRMVEINSDTKQASMILIKPIRRADYEPTEGTGTILRHIGNLIPQELLIRIEPGKDEEFMSSITSTPIRAGNYYIAGVKTIADRRKEANNQFDIKTFMAVMQSAFLLLFAFLGIFGTYWFRVQERVPEIAIRKVNGATDGNIMRRLFSESLILLSISTVLALGVCYLLMDKELTSEFQQSLPTKWLYIAMVLTALAMAVIVLAGIIIPARKALKIDPALALKDQ